MDVSYLEKINGNVAKIHREFEKESSRKLPRLEEEKNTHEEHEIMNTHTL